MEDMFRPLRRYADFSGRARRREYWLWTLFVLLVEFVMFAWIVAAAAGSGGRMTTGVAAPFVLVMLFGLAVTLPSLAVTVRRLHDTARSGWHYLLIFVPLAGAIVLLVHMCSEGTRGPNAYGPDPKAREGDAARDAIAATGAAR